MRSTYIINHTHNKLCAYVQMYIYVQVSLGIAQSKKMLYTYMPQALKYVDTHLILHKINDIYRGYVFLRFLVRSG